MNPQDGPYTSRNLLRAPLHEAVRWLWAVALVSNPLTTRRPMTATMVTGILILIAAAVVVGIGVHHEVLTGACSSADHNPFGHTATCQSGSGGWTGFLIVGIIGSFVGARVAGGPGALTSQYGVSTKNWWVIAPLFAGIGIGSVTVPLASSAGSSGSSFALLFGGAFMLAAPVVLYLGLRSSRRGGLEPPWSRAPAFPAAGADEQPHIGGKVIEPGEGGFVVQPGGGGEVGDLEKLSKLHRAGELSDSEFAAAKGRLLEHP